MKRLADAVVRLSPALVKLTVAMKRLADAVVRLSPALVKLADAVVKLSPVLVKLADVLVKLADASHGYMNRTAGHLNDAARFVPPTEVVWHPVRRCSCLGVRSAAWGNEPS